MVPPHRVDCNGYRQDLFSPRDEDALRAHTGSSGLFVAFYVDDFFPAVMSGGSDVMTAVQLARHWIGR